ncbi:hypothetical protein [Streptobacillus notomytis]|uniref:hypothetical protein n=1 Tax=Streptobacillus notomytis TaxID=1712031 RepID=UPI000936D167|nr:hypothetical protein [Streptobacillus notomytis]
MIKILLKKANFEYLLEMILNLLPYTLILNIIPLFIIEFSLKSILILSITFILQVCLLFKLADIFE